MPTWEGEKPDEYHPRGGMRAGGYVGQTNISGAAAAGLLNDDMRPDVGISGIAWLGIAAIVVFVVLVVWSWVAGL